MVEEAAAEEVEDAKAEAGAEEAATEAEAEAEAEAAAAEEAVGAARAASVTLDAGTQQSAPPQEQVARLRALAKPACQWQPGIFQGEKHPKA